MENEWGEGPASRCVGTVWRSTADDTTRSEAGYCGKMLRRERVRKPEGEICPAIRRRATDRGDHAGFSCCGELFHAAMLPSGGERSCISTAVNLSTTAIGPPHLGQDQRSLGLAAEACCSVCGVPPSSWEQSGKGGARFGLAGKPQLRGGPKPSRDRGKRERR